MAVQLQEYSPDLIVGTPFFVCTSMVAAKLGVPYVTIAPGDFMPTPSMHLRKATSCRLDLPHGRYASYCLRRK